VDLSLVSAVIRGRWLLKLERVKSNRELVVLQMLYRGVRPPAAEFGKFPAATSGRRCREHPVQKFCRF